MNEQPLLTIVIPCYNDSGNLIKTLKKIELVIDSSIEIVVVDDCSPDGSYEKLNSYKKISNINNLFILRNSINSGPGESRNYGIEQSKGKYITFLDSDDWLSSDFFEIIKPILGNYDYDCIIHEAIIKNEDGSEYIWKPFLADLRSDELEKKNILVFSKGCPWAKIYKRSIIRENNVKFLKLKRKEDFPFTKIAISLCNKFLYLQRPLYFYYQNANSLMHNKALLDVNNSYQAFDAVTCKINPIFNEELEAMYIVNLYSISLIYLETLPKNKWLKKIKNLEEQYKNYLRNKYIKKYSWYIKLVVYLTHSKSYHILKLLNSIRKIVIYAIYRIK